MDCGEASSRNSSLVTFGVRVPREEDSFLLSESSFFGLGIWSSFLSPFDAEN